MASAKKQRVLSPVVEPAVGAVDEVLVLDEAPEEDLRTYTRVEVAEEASLECMLVIIGEEVFDLTAYADRHPGGTSVLMSYVGRDATSAFEAIGHSGAALRIREGFLVGRLVEARATDTGKE